MGEAYVSFVRFRRSLALSTDPLFDRRFDISFPSAVPNNTDLSRPLLFIFATGPLLPSSTLSLPQLLPHAASAAFFSGSINITLNAAKATNSCEPLWNTPELSYPPLPPGFLPSPPGEPSMWDDGAVISGLSQCSTTFEGENRKFASCEALPGGFFFMWTLGKEELSGAFISQSVSPQGYAAVGLLLPPPTPLLEALFTPPPAPAGGNESAEGGYVKPDSLVGASMLVAVRAEDGSGGLKVEEYQIVKQEGGSSNASATGSTTTGTLTTTTSSGTSGGSSGDDFSSDNSSARVSPPSGPLAAIPQGVWLLHARPLPHPPLPRPSAYPSLLRILHYCWCVAGAAGFVLLDAGVAAVGKSVDSDSGSAREGEGSE
ncbi:unnamed protein product [Closterium sp. NIES-54]